MRSHVLFRACTLGVVALACGSSAFGSAATDNGCVGDPVTTEWTWLKAPPPRTPKRAQYTARIRLHLRQDGTVSNITFDRRTGSTEVDEGIVGVFSKWKMGRQWRNCSVAVIPLTVIAKR